MLHQYRQLVCQYISDYFHYQDYYILCVDFQKWCWTFTAEGDLF